MHTSDSNKANTPDVARFASLFEAVGFPHLEGVPGAVEILSALPPIRNPFTAGQLWDDLHVAVTTKRLPRDPDRRAIVVAIAEIARIAKQMCEAAHGRNA